MASTRWPMVASKVHSVSLSRLLCVHLCTVKAGRASEHNRVSEELWRRLFNVVFGLRPSVAGLLYWFDSWIACVSACFYLCVCVGGEGAGSVDVNRLVERTVALPHKPSHLWEGKARQSVPVRPPDWRSCVIGIHQSSATRCSCVSGMTAVCSGCQWRPVDLEKLLISPHNKTKRPSGHLSLILIFVFGICWMCYWRKKTYKAQGVFLHFPFHSFVQSMSALSYLSFCSYQTGLCWMALLSQHWQALHAVNKPVQFVPLVHEKKKKISFLNLSFSSATGMNNKKNWILFEISIEGHMETKAFLSKDKCACVGDFITCGGERYTQWN